MRFEGKRSPDIRVSPTTQLIGHRLSGLAQNPLQGEEPPATGRTQKRPGEPPEVSTAVSHFQADSNMPGLPPGGQPPPPASRKLC